MKGRGWAVLHSTTLSRSDSHWCCAGAAGGGGGGGGGGGKC